MVAILVIVFVVWIVKAVITAMIQTAAQLRARKAYMMRQAEVERLNALRRQDAEERERQRQLILQSDLRIVQQQREALIIQQETRRQMEKDRKQEEKIRRMEFERRQAEEDLEHYSAVREGYLHLLDELQEELDAPYTTEKRRNILRRQILQLEEKVYAIDKKRARAYYLIEKGA